jgi:hypothetical protein
MRSNHRVTEDTERRSRLSYFLRKYRRIGSFSLFLHFSVLSVTLWLERIGLCLCVIIFDVC